MMGTGVYTVAHGFFYSTLITRYLTQDRACAVAIESLAATMSCLLVQ